MRRRRPLQGTSADALLLTVIKLVTVALSFTVTRILSDSLSVHDYGTYSQILLIISTVTSITILGMMDGINYFFCREEDPQKRESYIATIFSLQCLISGVAGGAVFVLKGVISHSFGNSDVEGYILFAALLPLLQNLISMLQVLLVARGKAKILAVRNLTVSLLRLAVVWLIVSVTKNIAVILLTNLLLDLLQIAFFLLILRKNQCRIPISKVNFKLIGEILRYCAPMAIFLILNTLNRDCDKYLIASMTDTETLAVYSNASKVLPFDIIMSSFCTVLLPKITRHIGKGEKAEAANLYRLFLEIAYLSTTVLCCTVLCCAPQAMELLYTEKYLSGVPVFCIYIFVDLLRFTNLTMVLSAAGKTKKLMFIAIGSLAVNFGLNFLLFRLFGVIGPALATLLVTLGVGLLILCFSARELDTRLPKLFDLKYFFLFVGENLALLLLLSLLQRLLVRVGLHYLPILLTVGGLYCLTMMLLNGKRLLRLLKRVNSATEG